MNAPTTGPVLDAALLAPPVRRALDAPDAMPVAWQVVPAGYRVINQVTAGLYRVSGSATTAEGPRDWALFLKLLRHGAGAGDAHFVSSDEPDHWNYWRREALVYGSDLLAQLPPALAVPRCYGVSVPASGMLWLWLEPIDGLSPAAWPLERFGLAARHLGQFQAAFAQRPPPDLPWLSRRWLRAWVPSGAPPDLLADPVAWQRIGLPGSAAATATALWRERDRLIAAVEQLPQTLCHLDFWPPNLFARRLPDGRDQTVLIDWSQTGYGAPGEDIANLVLDSLWMFWVDPAMLEPFEGQIWQGYLAGLGDAAWDGDLRLVRLAYTLTAGLRFGLLGGGLLRLAIDTPRHAELEQRYGRPVGQIIAARAAAAARGLALGEEGLALLGELALFLP